MCGNRTIYSSFSRVLNCVASVTYVVCDPAADLPAMVAR